ncbi:hypothetical protein JCM10207_002363 [Rhodosporidiobolus poonsookiae]
MPSLARLAFLGFLLSLVTPITALPTVGATPTPTSTHSRLNPTFIAPALPILVASSKPKPCFDRIIVFGDSYSDDGTGAYRLTNGTWPSNPAYFGHRFSNNFTWTEQLAHSLKVPTTSYAIAGATTNNSLVQGYTGPNFDIPVFSVNEQVSVFIKTTPVRPDALYVLQGGLVDFLLGQAQGGVSGNDSAASLGNAMLQLSGYGAKHILLATVPNFSPHFPYTTNHPSAEQRLYSFSLAFRNALYAFNVDRPNVAIVDHHALFSAFQDTPEIFVFDQEVLDRACLKGVYKDEGKGNATLCKTPEEYLWWDELHPGSVAQSRMAAAALSTLIQEGWVTRSA